MKLLDNFELHEKENYVLVSINPKIYPLEVVYSACYVLMDQAFVVIDGNPLEGLVVTIRPKTEKDLEILAREFNNELINYSVHRIESQRTKELREALVKEAFLTQSKLREGKTK